MRKELIISTIPQETRVALVEDDELVEFLIERHRAQGIVGNIYKGRVTKVLPGMQSAFVDIGLERDAFLYVSDFVEDGDEYDKIVSTAEEKALEAPTTAASSPRGTGSRTRSRKERRPSEQVPKSSAGAPDAVVPAAAGSAATVEDSEPAPAVPGSPDTAGAPDPIAVPDAVEVQAADKSEREKSFERPAGPRRTERRERRGRVPSFEPRPEGRSGSGLQVLPGETLAKYRSQAAEELPAEAGGVSDRAGSAPGLDEGDLAETTDTLAERPTNGKESVNRPDDSGSDSAGTEDQAGEGAPEAGEGAPEAGEGAPEAGEGAPEAGEGAPEAGEGAPADAPARARISDPPPSAKFSRRPPARRSRRRQPSKSEASAGNGSEEPKISDLLRAGQEILVQISKEPLGKKGARITSHIALPGRYLVYMPTVDHVGVSRKISTEDERARLRRVINDNREGFPGGFIVRTAAEGRDEEEFVQDLRFLGDLWKEIREKSEQTSAPAMIHSDLNLVEKVLRDQLTDEFRAIRLDSEEEYARVLEFVSRFQPSLVNRVRLHLKDTPILEEYGVAQEIDKAMRSKVWLKSGGYIVVNQTEALVAIDVNTGKFVGKSNRLEDTIVRTNIDAVHEIVRQIRLRNLGGIIVVDFIDMEERKNRQRVMQALEEELRKDKSPSKSLQFNDFGLVAITRKRTQPSLERVLGRPCPRCSGAGFVKALETVCYEIQQEVRKMLTEIEGRELTVRVNPEVAKAIKSGEFVDFTELEEETRKDIRIKGDPTLDAERFDIF